MNLQQIELALAVFRTRSFTAAAAEAGVAPSTAVRLVAALEKELGVRLFQRTTRRVAPTEAGAQFCARTGPAVEEIRAAAGAIGDEAERPSGRVRATASVSFGEIVLAPQLGDFFGRFPDIRLDLVLSDAALDLVSEGLDIAVRHGPLGDASFIARRIGAVRYFLVATPDCLASAPRIENPADLQRLPLLAFTYPGFSTWSLTRGRRRAEISATPVLAASNASALRVAARAGLGVALLADWTVREDLAEGRLVRVLPEWEASAGDPDAAISILMPSRAYVPARVRVFAEFVQSAFQRATRP